MSAPIDTKKLGKQAEDFVCHYLQKQKLKLITRNYSCRYGEIDLIMRAPDGTLVFVEVRKRAALTHGGAAASVGFAKQRRIIFAARFYLMGLANLPPCRFDVIAMEPAGVQWLQAAFDAG